MNMHALITRTYNHPWTRYHVIMIQLCSLAYLEVAPKPYNRPKPRRKMRAVRQTRTKLQDKVRIHVRCTSRGPRRTHPQTTGTDRRWSLNSAQQQPRTPLKHRCNAAKIASHQEPGSRGRVLDGRQSLGATPTVLANAKRRKEVGLRHPPCGLRTRQTRVNAVFSRTARRQPAQTSIAACIQRLEGHGHVALPLVVDDGQIPRA